MIFDLCECLKGAVKDRRFSIPREAVGQDLNQETLKARKFQLRGGATSVSGPCAS